MEKAEYHTQKQISQCLCSVLCDTAANKALALRDFYTIFYPGPLGELLTEPGRVEAPARELWCSALLCGKGFDNLEGAQSNRSDSGAEKYG